MTGGGSGISSMSFFGGLWGAPMWEDAVVSFNVCHCSMTMRYGRCRGKSYVPRNREVLTVGCLCRY